MTENLRVPAGCPNQVLGFGVASAIEAADVASQMATPFGYYNIPDRWRATRAFRTIPRMQRNLNLAAPYIETMSGFDDPAAQLAADLSEVRNAVELDLLRQNQAPTYAAAARSVTPGQVAQSIESVVGDRLFAPADRPGALRVPLLRGLADTYIKQHTRGNLGPAAADLVRLPGRMVLKAAAPEILVALGFAPNHPMVRSVNEQGGFMRSMGQLVARRKLQAITTVPLLVHHVRGMLPPSGEQLRRSFGEVQRFMGALTAPPRP